MNEFLFWFWLLNVEKKPYKTNKQKILSKKKIFLFFCQFSLINSFSFSIFFFSSLTEIPIFSIFFSIIWNDHHHHHHRPYKTKHYYLYPKTNPKKRNGLWLISYWHIFPIDFFFCVEEGRGRVEKLHQSCEKKTIHLPDTICVWCVCLN